MLYEVYYGINIFVVVIAKMCSDSEYPYGLLAASFIPFIGWSLVWTLLIGALVVNSLACCDWCLGG